MATLVSKAISNSREKNILMKSYQRLSPIWSSSLRRNILKVFSGDVVSKFIRMAAALLIIRELSVDDFAAYTAFVAVSVSFSGILGSGVNRALVRFSTEHISKTETKPFELYFINFVFQFGLYCGCGVVFLIFRNTVTKMLFGQQSFGSALSYGLLAGLGFLITQAGRSVYQAEEKFGSFVKTLWLRQIMIFLVIFCLFSFKQLNYPKAAQSITLVEIIVAGIITVRVFQNWNFIQVIQFLKTRSQIIRTFILSAGWLIAYSFILECFSRLGFFMISHLSDKVELANYGVATRFYALALLALGSIHSVLLPKFSKVQMQDKSKQKQFTLKWIKATGWIIIPIIFADVYLKHFFIWIVGAEYEKAFYILVVLTVGIWISLACSPLVSILVARNLFKFLAILALGAFLINFMGNYVLIPIIGGIGAALAIVLSHAFLNVTSTVVVLLSKT